MVKLARNKLHISEDEFFCRFQLSCHLNVATQVEFYPFAILALSCLFSIYHLILRCLKLWIDFCKTNTVCSKTSNASQTTGPWACKDICPIVLFLPLKILSICSKLK